MTDEEVNAVVDRLILAGKAVECPACDRIVAVEHLDAHAAVCKP